MAARALASYTEQVNDLVTGGGDPAGVAAGAARALPGLLGGPDFLEDRYRVARSDSYTQHVLYVHPEGAYSVVALVWLPGQATPIHDHRCWCVVGVLEGQERETSYSLCQSPAGDWLQPRTVRRNGPGAVSSLLPPQENIHRVENLSSGLTVSIHVYGADIARLGTSINQTFDLPVRDAPGAGRPVAWRTAAPG